MSLMSTEFIILDFLQVEYCNLQPFARLLRGSRVKYDRCIANEKLVYLGQTRLIF